MNGESEYAASKMKCQRFNHGTSGFTFAEQSPITLSHETNTFCITPAILEKIFMTATNIIGRTILEPPFAKVDVGSGLMEVRRIRALAQTYRIALASCTQ